LQQNNYKVSGQQLSHSRFPPAVRLRKRSDFLGLKGSGNKFAVKGILVVWQENNLPHARVGITASKKIGCAVIRNKIKRFVREIFRRNRSLLPAVDLNVIARSQAAVMQYDDVQRELLRAFRHIGISSCSKALHS
jgi:ribonuclease P protein component